MKVLIIEDDANTAYIINKELMHGYNIEPDIAINGVEAYKILFNTKPEEKYELDLKLPDENGVEIGKFIRSKFTSKIIIYTASWFVDYKDKCEYDYFIEKGYGFEPVINIIKKEFFNRYS